jgi:hypothetical protein
MCAWHTATRLLKWTLLTHALVVPAAQAKRIRGLFDKNQGLVSSLTTAGDKLQCCAWPRCADDRGIALCQVVNNHVSRLLWLNGDLQRFPRCNL